MADFDKDLRKILLFIFRSTRTEKDVYVYTKFNQYNTTLSECFDYCIQQQLVEFSSTDDAPNSFSIYGLSTKGLAQLRKLDDKRF